MSGYTVAAWVAPLAIGTFCLGLFIGAENTIGGRFRVPFVSHHIHSPHLAHHSVVAELRGDPRIRASTIQAPALGSLADARRASLLDSAAQTLQVRAAGRTDALALTLPPWSDRDGGHKSKQSARKAGSFMVSSNARRTIATR